MNTININFCIFNKFPIIVTLHNGNYGQVTNVNNRISINVTFITAAKDITNSTYGIVNDVCIRFISIICLTAYGFRIRGQRIVTTSFFI